MNFSDRYLSLLLGLPAASEDDSFATPGRIDAELPSDRLSKLHCVISGAIIKRNASYNGKGAAATDASFRTTQAIDRSLEVAANSSMEFLPLVSPPLSLFIILETSSSPKGIIANSSVLVSAEWWQPVERPDTATASSKELIDAHTHVMMQMNHYHLLTLLHLPYLYVTLRIPFPCYPASGVDITSSGRLDPLLERQSLTH